MFGEQGHQEGLTQCNATKKVSSKEGPKVELPPRAVSDRCECGGGGRTMQPWGCSVYRLEGIQRLGVGRYCTTDMQIWWRQYGSTLAICAKVLSLGLMGTFSCHSLWTYKRKDTGRIWSIPCNWRDDIASNLYVDVWVKLCQCYSHFHEDLKHFFQTILVQVQIFPWVVYVGSGGDPARWWNPGRPPIQPSSSQALKGIV